MTRQEFEAEFKEKIQTPWSDNEKARDWHDYVLSNLYKLSHRALRYIVDNEGNPFGGWLVVAAEYHSVFEETVLKDGN